MRACFLCGKKHPFNRRGALRIQAATPAKLRRLVAGLSPAQLRRRPQPRKWSAQEIALHLLDVELAYAFRFRKIVAEPGTLLVPFNQDRWADSLAYRKQDLRAALDAFAQLRKANLKLLASLSPAEWRRAGKHQEYGRYPLEPIFLHLAAHDLNHLEQVRSLRSRWLS